MYTIVVSNIKDKQLTEKTAKQIKYHLENLQGAHDLGEQAEDVFNAAMAEIYEIIGLQNELAPE